MIDHHTGACSPVIRNTNIMAADKEKNKKKVSFLSTMSSVAAASFGVQTNKNRERDFDQGQFHHFVIGGIIFAVLFILLIIGIVKVVMHFGMA